MRRNTRRIPALSSTIKNVIYSLCDRSHIRAPADVVPEIIENLDQAYISTRTKDIEDATYRTVWFHMGGSPGNEFPYPDWPILSARLLAPESACCNSDCARVQVSAPVVVRWDGGSRLRNQSRG
jgi:hypothetical protein